MNINTKEVEIILTGSEARMIAYHILHSLKHSIDAHYISTHHDSYKRGFEGYAKPLLFEQEGDSIKIMNQLMAINGDDETVLENDLLRYFEEEYLEKNGSLDLKNENS